MTLIPKITTARRRCAAFTLAEMMVAAAVYLVLMVSVLVAIQIFALRVYAVAAIRLQATQDGRKALNQIRDDIRQATLLQVGNADNSGNFTAIAATNAAVGNALQVFAGTNQGPPYSIYYLQTTNLGAVSGNGGISSNLLWWISVATNASSGGSFTTNTTRLACFITNLDLFAAEDWQSSWPGTTITNSLMNNQVYSVKLQFNQFAYPMAIRGSNSNDANGFYQLRTRVCRRALN